MDRKRKRLGELIQQLEANGMERFLGPQSKWAYYDNKQKELFNEIVKIQKELEPVKQAPGVVRYMHNTNTLVGNNMRAWMRDKQL